MAEASSNPNAPVRTAATAPSRAAGLDPALLIGGGIVLVLLGAVFWSFFARQLKFAIRFQADWGHTLVIPFIAGYFVWVMRDRLLARPFKTTWLGFVPIVLGVGIYVLCSVGPAQLIHHNLQGAGVALTLFGVTLLFCGFRAMLLLWFPLLYLAVFGQTISERLLNIVTFRLQDITAVGAELMFVVLGLDVERSGNTLTLIDSAGQPTPLNIAEACSGMRMLMAFMALGVALAFTNLKRFWQRAVVVLMGLPVSIFVNVLRVVTLGLLARVNQDFAVGEFHSFIGLVWLVPALMLFLGVIWVVRKTVNEETT